MPSEISDVQIKLVRGYWEVYINGEFFWTADNYLEAINEIYKTYGGM